MWIRFDACMIKLRENLQETTNAESNNRTHVEIIWRDKTRHISIELNTNRLGKITLRMSLIGVIEKGNPFAKVALEFELASAREVGDSMMLFHRNYRARIRRSSCGCGHDGGGHSGIAAATTDVGIHMKIIKQRSNDINMTITHLFLFL